MNCEQVEELLPLYVGRDLEAGRERLVTVHVESCAACFAAATEHRQTRELIQELVPPAFSDDVYAGIRQNVWRRIESESTSQSQWDVITGLFRPRLTWALAIVALIAVSALGIYLIAGRLSLPQRIAVRDLATHSNGPDKERSKDETKVPPITSNEPPGSRLADRRTTHRRIRRSVIADRADSVAVAQGAPSLTVDPPTGMDNSAQPDASSDNNSKNTLRMEMQTKNPNIRIIWFSQRDAKRVFPSPKGI